MNDENPKIQISPSMPTPAHSYSPPQLHKVASKDNDDKAAAMLARFQLYQGKKKIFWVFFAQEINVQDYFGHQFAQSGREGK